ncbi:3-oxoacyl-reductase [Bimuria novae-zelandiae CBS 107.79]|uniref:3-oxoacyl-reductase n=1 Tax=Bimuria novae-zelandiae CBS 107.79 TaxID=1447943 RepID=A0A6A5V4H4_9PLEO|nr:3-oxoacyl-reductase [Bimuria novae-zelandiae CBS 107.79]
MADDLSVPKLFEFSQYVVLVTGGASGLGEMAAQAFVQNGARVIIASRKEGELRKTCERLNGMGPGKCEYIVADLKDKAGCVKLCEEVKKRTDRLHILLNNSGATWGADYYSFPESGWDKLMALNVKSIFYVTVGLEPLLLAASTPDNPARVINVASIAGIQTLDVTTGDEGGLAQPGQGTFSYGPSKAAAIHLSKMLASKLAPRGVCVNVIAPGVFPSKMTSFGLERFGERLVSGQPTGRIGRPRDFGGVVLFLSSLASAHMTGNVIELDGGANLTGWKGNAKSESKI